MLFAPQCADFFRIGFPSIRVQSVADIGGIVVKLFRTNVAQSHTQHAHHIVFA